MDIAELKYYSDSIEKIATDIGLTFYEQEFEIISYSDMIGYATYLGMPSHYPHWSLGKNYDKLKTYYENNIMGLPYEIVINSNPCIAYLVKDNSPVLHILTMAHVYGHNDFFKNNYLFSAGTNAEYAIPMFKNHANRVRNYIQLFGYAQVEKILDAIHSIKMYSEENSLLSFLIENTNLNEWQKDLLNIVMLQNRYFMPQLQTKIMNEGWASFWHYNILKKLELSVEKYLEFITIHNNVVCPTNGALNPYYLGFKIWENIYNNYGLKDMLIIRELNSDTSFIRNYLTDEICKSANLYAYIKQEKNYIVSDTTANNIRNALINTIGLNSIPKIEVEDYDKLKNQLVLVHVSDNRELDLSFATETLKYIQTLSAGTVVLKTFFSGIKRQIVCDTNKKIYIQNE
ncbi:MAG: hypothetical protein BEN19_02975 [Epulopiscium sp. Nuni2H_MBin003]|nr:MAG: hypothetical protein BEN19_02975 [Epulopiscium sp. Nuni2H_MBin003]